MSQMTSPPRRWFTLIELLDTRNSAVPWARFLVLAALMVGVVATPSVGYAAFGLTSDANFYTVDTGGGLVFKVRRTDKGVSTQSVGDLASLVFNGVEYQDKSRGSQVNGGFDFLYKGVTDVTLDAVVVNPNFIKITVRAGVLTPYHLARTGYPHTYVGPDFRTR